MTMSLPSFRRLYLFVLIAFTAGCASGLFGKTILLLQCSGLFLPVLFLLNAKKHKILLNLPLQNWLILLLAPIVASGYTTWRLSLTYIPLQKYANRSIIVLGKLSEKLPSKSPQCDNYLLEMERVIFPDRHYLHAKTQITIRRVHEEQDAALPLMKTLMFRVAVRTSDDSIHDPYNQINQSDQNNQIN